MSMGAGGATFGEASIEIGAEDNTDVNLRKIEQKLIRSVAASSERAGRAMIDRFQDAADKSGDRMIAELSKDFKVIEHQINELTKDRQIAIQAELEAAAARAEVMWLQRDRFVNLWVRIRGSAEADLAAIVKGLSGASLVRSFMDSLVALGNSFPQVILRIGAFSTALVTLINPLLNVLTTIAPLGADIGKLGGFLMALPAYGAAAAAGIGTIVAVFMDLKNATSDSAQSFYSNIQGIKDRLKDLRQTMQGNFFDAFAGPFARLADVVLPQLESGMARVSSAMGRQFGAVADSLANAFSANTLDAFFSNLEAGIDAATPGIAAIASALETIMSKGSDTFVELGNWISDIGKRFDNWAEGADIAGIIRNAAAALADLWEVGKQAWRVIAGIFTAMDTGKATGLDSLAATLQRVGDIVNGASFQTAMTTIFTGASEGASALADALIPIGNALESLAPTISNLLSSLGGAGATALTNIAEALAQPVAQNGINAAIEGISTLIAGIDFATVGAAIGALGTAIGSFAPILLGLVNSLISYLPGIVAGFGQFAAVAITVLQPLVGMIAPLLQIEGVVPTLLAAFAAWKVISPIIAGISTALLAWRGIMAGVAAAQAGVTLAVNASKAAKSGYAATVVAQGTLAAVSWVGNMIKMGAAAVANAAVAVGAWVAAFATMIARAVASGAVMVAQAAVAGGAWVASSARTVAALAAQGAAFLAQKAVMVAASAATGIATAAQWALNAAMSANPIGLIIAAIVALVAGLVWFFTQTELGQAIWGEFTRFLGEAWNNIVAFLTPAITFLGELFTNIFNVIKTVVETVIGFISAYIMTYVGIIVGIFTGDFSLVPDVVQDIFNNVLNFVVSIFTNVVNWITTTVSNLVTAWNNYWQLVFQGVQIVWNMILSTVVGLVTSLVNGIMSGINGFISFWVGAWNTVSSIVSDGVNNVINFVSSLPGRVQGFFAGAASWLYSAGRDILQGLWNGLQSIWGAISSWITNTVGGIANTVAGLFGIASPSKLFTYFGEMMTAGLVEGLKGMEAAATRQLTMELKPFIGKMDSNVPKYKDTTSHMGTSIVNNTRQQTIEAGAFALHGPDPYAIAREVQDVMAEEADY